ncbi:unnamed protein product [Lasius platythorax]|uniref:Uncharacterized protein n=1 Tax=Lasius platythorax TaxID=488582 RepID=A0AAV2NBB3_9HYME
MDIEDKSRASERAEDFPVTLRKHCRRQCHNSRKRGSPKEGYLMRMPRGREEQANEKRYPLVPDSLAKSNGSTIEGKSRSAVYRTGYKAPYEMSFYQMAMEMSAIIRL